MPVNLDSFTDISAELNSKLKKRLEPLETASPEEQWQEICQVASQYRISPRDLRRLWQQLFDGKSVTDSPMWWPTSKASQGANLTRWMQLTGEDSYSGFHEWSAQHRADFWKMAIAQLGIVFADPPSAPIENEADPENVVWMPNATMNIVESCFQAAPDASAVVFQKPGEQLQQISYKELRRMANRVANSVVAARFQPGDAIAVVLPMTAESVAIYLGLVAAGCPVVSIADSFAAPEIGNRLKIADAKAVFTYDLMARGGKSIPLFDRVKQATDLPIITLPIGESVTAELRPHDLDWNEFLVADDHFDPVVVPAHETLNILFSSGTTGDPKAIPWNHLTAIKCATDGSLHQDIHPGDVVAWPTNLGWMMGPWLIFAALVNRATIALYEDAPLGEGFGRFVQESQVNLLGVVPTIVKAWRKSACMESFDWSAIRCFSSTGEASGAEDMFYLSALAGMKPVIEYCGGTEIGGAYITSTVLQPNIPAAFSSAAAGLDFVLLNSDGEAATQGELFLIPPSIGLSQRLLNRDHHQTYFAGVGRGPDQQVLRRHGDHMRRLQSGYYVAGGRVDDTMNLGGIKVSSAEIERILNLIDGVKETAAVAFADQQGPNQLAIFAVMDSDATSIQNEMNKQLKQQLNPLFKIARLEGIAELPRTASGKVMRRKLRDRLERS